MDPIITNPDKSTEGVNPSQLEGFELNKMGHAPLPPLKAIRLKCIDCSGNSKEEAKKCVAVDCVLWPYRLGKNPFRAKKTLSPEHLAALQRGRK